MDVAHLVGEVAHAGVVVGDVIGYLIGRSSVGVAGGELTAVLPVHAPGGFGTYAAGILAALLPFAVDADKAVAAAANTHLLLLGSALVSGG